MFFFSKLTNDPGYQKNERICQSDLARESLMPPFWHHGAAMAPNSFRLMILIRHWRNGEMGGGGGQENIGNVTREGDRERGEQIEWGGTTWNNKLREDWKATGGSNEANSSRHSQQQQQQQQEGFLFVTQASTLGKAIHACRGIIPIQTASSSATKINANFSAKKASSTCWRFFFSRKVYFICNSSHECFRQRLLHEIVKTLPGWSVL